MVSPNLAKHLNLNIDRIRDKNGLISEDFVTLFNKNDLLVFGEGQQED
jgi:hypothetical protein